MSRLTRRNPGVGGADLAAVTSLHVAGARPVVAAQFASQNIVGQFTGLNSKTAHLVTVTCSDLRLVFTPGVIGSGTEADLTNPVLVKVGASADGTTWYPVTFGGRQTGQLDPAGVLVSDSIPFDVTAGSTIYVSSFLTQAFGPSTTLAANSNIGATTLTINVLPKMVSGYMVVGTGSGAETVSVDTFTGSGPTYTANLAAGTTCAKAHTSGDFVGQQLLTTRTGYADLGESVSTSTSATPTDRSYTGSYSALGAGTTTVAGGSTIAAGSTSVPLSANLAVPTLVLGSGGTSETVTIRNLVGTTAPFTAYLTAATAFSHAAGETVTAGTGKSALFAPAAIVADRTAGSPVAVVGVGTSIMGGTGYLLRNYVSYASLAFEGHTPFVNLAIGGEWASQFVTFANSVRRRRLLSLGRWLLVNYPTNDFANSRTLGQVQADTATIVGLARNRGMKVALETCIPRTASTDSWATVGNQTLPSWEANRLAYNTWIRGGAGGLADLVVDTDAQIDSGLVVGGAATGKWRVDGANGPWTSDGVHPATIGHVAMAAAVVPARFA